MRDRIYLALVEDDPVTRDALALHVRRIPDFKLLATYESAEEVLRAPDIKDLHVMLMDINLPGRSGIECVADLAVVHPRLQILMLTVHDDDELIFAALRAGASGYLLKRATPRELVNAVREVHAGGSPMSVSIARKVVSHFHQTSRQSGSLKSLTVREREILALLAEGSYYKEIADRLGISVNTVRNHLHEIYGKLHVQSRTEAVLKYFGR